MIRNYLIVAFRNLTRNKLYGLINIVGLAIGMAVSLLIGLWVYDELSFNKYHKNYDRIARVMETQNFNGNISSQFDLPFPLGEELRNRYGSDFDRVSMASWNYGHFLDYGEKKISTMGIFVEPDFINMFSIKIVRGDSTAFHIPHTIILSESLAKIIFGNEDPIGKMIRIDNFSTVKTIAVFKDLPNNSNFSEVKFLVPWQLYAMENEWVKNAVNNWSNFSFQAFVQLRPAGDFETVSRKIMDLILVHDPKNDSKPTLFLHPMSKWHLYSDFDSGAGDIRFIWLFGIIGCFVLMLACINFMNLSTARSEQRAREVGVRKSIGSLRMQLVIQFLSESFLFVVASFFMAIVFVQLSLNWFNQLTGKDIDLPLFNIYFWMASIFFILFTGLLAGSYPALYLSSFNPVKILKGTFRVGRSAALPRKIMVVAQFAISVSLIIGTIIVYRQILHATNRPIGYDKNGLITTYGYPFPDFSNSPRRYDYLQNELMKSGGIVSMAKTSSSTTAMYSFQSDFDWEGHDPNLIPDFGVVWCSHDFGKTIGWHIVEGRDFSRDYPTDTAAMILNTAAVNFMGLTDPIGKIVTYNKNVPLRVIGVVENVLMESPFGTIRPTAFMVDYSKAGVLELKLNPNLSVKDAMARIEPVFKNFSSSSLFEYQFADVEFGLKMSNEKRIGKLASLFSALAILISCLGLFGLASFVAEQRTKEIGVRKVLGASVFQIWKMLSRDFMVLVLLSFFIAIPISWWLLNGWLQKYEYRTEIAWWIFAIAGAGILLITLLTISFQAIKAAVSNPVISLRSE